MAKTITILGGDTVMQNVSENDTNWYYDVNTNVGPIFPDQNITYTLSGADAAYFNIDSKGVITLKNAADYELKTSYDVTITATHVSGGKDTQDLHLNVLNVNDNAPVITGPETVAIAIDENSAAVTTVKATDADGNLNPLVYSIAGGTDAELFNIDPTTGALSFKNAPDYENAAHASVYNVTVGVSDGTFSDTQDVTVTVKNINDNAPEITVQETVTINENSIAVTTATATDADGNLNPLTYSITGGADAELFNIDPATGELSFEQPPDYENAAHANVYNVTVGVSDGTFSDTQDVTVTVNNINDNAPEITVQETVTINENSIAVTTATATDADGDLNPLTYSIVGGADASLFAIDPDTGALSFIDSPDYENAGHSNIYNVTVGVGDGTFSDTQDVTVTVQNINDNAPVLSDVGVAVKENSAAGVVVANLSATDADGSLNSLTYSLVEGGTGNGLFEVADDGTITVAAGAVLDYETARSYTLNVQVSDGLHTDTAVITVSLNDVYEAPPTPPSPIIDLSGYTVIHGVPNSGGIINASDLSEVIYGTASADKINAKDGADILIGLGGDDRLSGQAGTDIFYFDAAMHEGTDTIVDFTRSSDKINIAHAETGKVHISTVGSNSIISIDGTSTTIIVQNQTITFEDITFNTLP